MFLLDTDHIGLLQVDEGEEAERLRMRMNRYSFRHFYFPIVSFHEQVVGWNNYANRAKGSAGVTGRERVGWQRNRI